MAKFSELQLLARVNEVAREVARDYLDVVGETLVDYLQKRLGEKDVETDGRSHRGEYPSRETASLQESINYQTYVRGGKVFLKFGSMDDTRLYGRDANPTLYARVLQFEMGRKLTIDAWEECRRSGIVGRAISKAKHERRTGFGEFMRVPGPRKFDTGGMSQDRLHHYAELAYVKTPGVGRGDFRYKARDAAQICLTIIGSKATAHFKSAATKLLAKLHDDSRRSSVPREHHIRIGKKTRLRMPRKKDGSPN